MKNYKWILFDADETLFHFDAFSGLQLMFSRFGYEFTLEDYHEYEMVNKPLWMCYQNGQITAQQLQYRRFNSWANMLQMSAKDLSAAFLAVMAEICTPIDGATNLLNALKGRLKLGIITNGFTDLQQARLEHTGLRGYFDLLVISEQVGIAKPNRGIFDYAISNMGNPSREQVLMVGDNPETDILGGINAGLDTCWFNIDNRPAPEIIKPQYQVSSFSELESLLLGNERLPATIDFDKVVTSF